MQKYIDNKPKRKKNKYQTERKKLIAELDRLTSLIVILRDKDCITPKGGCHGRLTCSHYYPRGIMRLRWDLNNCHCQCSGHNLRHNYNTSYYDLWMYNHYPKDELRELARLAALPIYKWGIAQLRELFAQYQTLYQGMLRDKPPSTYHPSETDQSKPINPGDKLRSPQDLALNSAFVIKDA